MKVYHVLPPFLPIHEDKAEGGIENNKLMLSQAQKNLGLDVRLIATADSTHELVVPTIKSIGLDTIDSEYVYQNDIRQHTWSKLLHINKTLEFLLNEKKDVVVHVSDDYFIPFMKFLKVPSIATIHTIPEYFWSAEQLKGENIRFVAVSKKQKEIFENQGILIKDVVYNGLDVSKFIPDFNKENYLLSLSAIAPHKGQHLAIDVAKRTNNNIIVAGNISDKVYFEEKIKPLVDFDISDSKNKLEAYLNLPESENGKVVYCGFADNEQKAKLYSKAKVFLMPTQVQETFGFVVVEALASGTPVVALNNGAMPELIRQSQTGYVCNNEEDMASAIIKLNDVDREVIGKFCVEDVSKRFSVEAAAKNYLRIYEDQFSKFYSSKN